MARPLLARFLLSAHPLLHATACLKPAHRHSRLAAARRKPPTTRMQATRLLLHTASCPPAACSLQPARLSSPTWPAARSSGTNAVAQSMGWSLMHCTGIREPGGGSGDLFSLAGSPNRCTTIHIRMKSIHIRLYIYI